MFTGKAVLMYPGIEFQIAWNNERVSK